MKKTAFLFIAGLLTLAVASSCENDDTDFSAYTLTADSDDDDDDTTTVADTIYITYTGSAATVSGDGGSVCSISNADVTVNDSASTTSLVLVLSGSTDDGSLLVYRSKKYTIMLNGVSITNADGPAINNQCGKSLYLVCADGTGNTLTDGTTYAEQSYDQKGTLFSEGQIYFSGAGTLTVNANCKNGIASDDYITISDDIAINVVTSTTGTNGIKANDGMYVNGGELNINVYSAGGRGIRCEARTEINGGTTTITTSGDCLIETTDGVADTTSAACIKCDSLFTMTAGVLALSSTGDGGKGLNCSDTVKISGGTFTAVTTGSKTNAKPKAVKGDLGIVISGGSFFACVNKSWACDNGSDSDEAEDRVTVEGTPASTVLEYNSETFTSPYYSQRAVFVAF